MDTWTGRKFELDAKVRAVLDEYDARMKREREIFATMPAGALSERRDEFLLPVGGATAQLMQILVEAHRPRTLVEVGTSYGFSAIWLGNAARNVGGTLHTLELSREKSDYARERAERAGLAKSVVFHVGDARDLIAEMKGPIDFVLIDLWKDLYIPCFDLLYPKLSKGALVIADNMLEPEAVRPQADAYRAHVRGKPGITSVLLNVGSGIEISRFD
jgi:predicted O-methyltransferase YrrM